jgi:transposase InsO family protein
MSLRPAKGRGLSLSKRDSSELIRLSTLSGFLWHGLQNTGPSSYSPALRQLQDTLPNFFTTRGIQAQANACMGTGPFPRKRRQLPLGGVCCRTSRRSAVPLLLAWLVAMIIVLVFASTLALLAALLLFAARRLPIGRPWLTLAIDVTTRMVARFHISLWGPSTVSPCLTLSHAVLPKNSWLADRELQNRAEQRRRPLDDVDLTGPSHVQVKLRWLRGLLLESISNRTPGWARIEAQRGVTPPVD